MNISQREDLVLLRIISALGQEVKFIDYLSSLRPQKVSLALLSDTIASIVVDQSGQSAAVATSLAKAQGSHTTFYVCFGSDAPAGARSHLQSIFSLLKNTDAGSDQVRLGALARILSRRMYEFSWKRWEYYLHELLEHLSPLRTGASLAVPELTETLDKIGCLGKELSSMEGAADRVEFAMITVEDLYTSWVENGLFAGQACRVTNASCDKFQHLTHIAYLESKESLHFGKWLSNFVSIHRNSTDLVRLASSTEFSYIF
ncbi:hypothetical protein PM082_015643 [Marasmius tenuissimus]|nr:hypothetical protein PM082_015643 [Marasmius tenuissimus]